jgi:hypothetical protein
MTDDPPVVSPEDMADVEEAIRNGITDAYRCGLGVAIRLITEYGSRSVDPDFVAEMTAILREVSIKAEPGRSS